VVPGGPLEGGPERTVYAAYGARLCPGAPRLWYGHRPVTWLVSLVIVPELVVILIAVNAVAEDATQGKRRTSPQSEARGR
jgi:hypothetical protein